VASLYIKNNYSPNKLADYITLFSGENKLPKLTLSCTQSISDESDGSIMQRNSINILNKSNVIQKKSIITKSLKYR
jgi:hypothetical protein